MGHQTFLVYMLFHLFI